MAVQPYKLYIDEMEIPITPSKLKEDVKGKNEVLELLNGESYTVIKDAKLPVFSFSFYAFSHEHPGVALFIPQEEIIEKLRSLKKEKKVFEFIVLRISSDVSLRNSICKHMTLEDFTIDEDSKYGTNNLITLKLQEYKPLKTQKLVEKNSDGDKKQVYKTTSTEEANAESDVEVAVTVLVSPEEHKRLTSGLATNEYKAMQDKKRSDSIW